LFGFILKSLKKAHWDYVNIIKKHLDHKAVDYYTNVYNVQRNNRLFLFYNLFILFANAFCWGAIFIIHQDEINQYWYFLAAFGIALVMDFLVLDMLSIATAKIGFMRAIHMNRGYYFDYHL
jgi:hypothetical protein